MCDKLIVCRSANSIEYIAGFLSFSPDRVVKKKKGEIGKK